MKQLTFLATIADWARRNWDKLTGRFRREPIIPSASILPISDTVDGNPPVLAPATESVVGRLARRFYAEGNKRITETLYRDGHGQYLIKTRTLYRGKGLRTVFDMCEIDKSDLEEGGRYAALGEALRA